MSLLIFCRENHRERSCTCPTKMKVHALLGCVKLHHSSLWNPELTVRCGRCSRGWSCHTNFVTTVAQATLTCLAQSKRFETAKRVAKCFSGRKWSTVTPLLWLFCNLWVIIWCWMLIMLATICLLAPTVGYMEMCLICLKIFTMLILSCSSALAKFHGIWSPFAWHDNTIFLCATSYRELLPQRVLNPWHSSLQLLRNCLEICKPVFRNKVLLLVNSQSQGDPL